MTLPNPLLTQSDEILNGTPVFTGTRVPVRALIDYLEGGDRLDDFLAVAVLELAKEALVSLASAA